MRTTGIYTQSLYTIPFKHYGEEIEIIPFGDVHRTSPLCHVERWHEFLAWAKKRKNAFFVGLGDYCDLASTSERKVLKSDELHESTKYELESLYRKQTMLFANEIDFMKGRLIGLVEGNHYAYLQSGISTTQLLAEVMQCKYLGVSAFIMLLIKMNRHDVIRLDMFLHHGLGGGRRVGASVNKLEDMIRIADAQIYLMGHDHRKSVVMDSRLKLRQVRDGVDLDEQQIIMARTGSFLKGYENEKPSYIADGALAPVDLGNISITLIPRRHKARRKLELHATL